MCELIVNTYRPVFLFVAVNRKILEDKFIKLQSLYLFLPVWSIFLCAWECF